MNCEDWQLLVEEYFDGELDTHTALKVRHHLDGCRSCSAVLESLSAEQSVYANYRSDVEMSPELWAAVRRGIEAERPPVKRSGSWLRKVLALPPVSTPVAVGLVVLAVVSTVVVMRYFSSSAPTGVSESVVTETKPQATPEMRNDVVVAPVKSEKPISAKDNVTKGDGLTAATRDRRSQPPRGEVVPKTKDPHRLVLEAEQKYLTAIAMLSRSVDRKRSRLNPATKAELEQALSSIDRTIAATRKLVRRHPDDPVAAQYMLTAYAKKVDMLRELVDY
ncbi:MAG TPA: anti-sigma factor [Pyrinomonadaceae bacterium]